MVEKKRKMNIEDLRDSFIIYSPQRIGYKRQNNIKKDFKPLIKAVKSSMKNNHIKRFTKHINSNRKFRGRK